MKSKDEITKLDSLSPETKKEIEDLDICLYDIVHIDEAMKTLMMYLFASPYMKSIDEGTVEFYKEEANEIHQGFVSLRKFQRLINLLEPTGNDQHKIGIALKPTKH